MEIEKLQQIVKERERMRANAARLQQQLTLTQQDWRAPHIGPSCLSLPAVPQIVTDRRTLGAHRTHKNPQNQSGGFLPSQDVNHFLTVRINSIKDAVIDRTALRKGRELVLANGPKQEEALNLHEQVSHIARMLESGVISGKLLERTALLMASLAKAAPTLDKSDATALASEIADTADEADAKLESSAVDSKGAFVLQALIKQLRDLQSLLESALGFGSQADKRAQISQARARIAKRPVADAKARRDENKRALEDAENERVAAAQAARDEEAQAAQELAAQEAREGPQPPPVRPGARDVRSPTMKGLAKRQHNAQRRREEAEAAVAEVHRQPRLPARGTDRYRELVQAAFTAPGNERLRELCTVYNVHPIGATKASARAALLNLQ